MTSAVQQRLAADEAGAGDGAALLDSVLDRRCSMEKERRGIPAKRSRGAMRFDGVAFLRADTHRGWGSASMARAAARWARFS
jgi:hypothetical protein